MTGGHVVVLGSTGRNFAAGMSGGIAYVLDETGDFDKRCNKSMVELEAIDEPEHLKGLIKKHLHYTNSSRAQTILDNWNDYLPRFIKVMPTDYKRALLQQKG
jgi:glutamate synthase domain-containing protein 3